MQQTKIIVCLLLGMCFVMGPSTYLTWLLVEAWPVVFGNLMGLCVMLCFCLLFAAVLQDLVNVCKDKEYLSWLL